MTRPRAHADGWSVSIRRLSAVGALIAVSATVAVLPVSPAVAVGSWSVEAQDMLTPRASHTATLLQDGQVLVAGGVAAASVPVPENEVFAPDGGTWTRAEPMVRQRYRHTATLLPDGRVLVAGGLVVGLNGVQKTTRTAEIYDPATGDWTDMALMAVSRMSHTATLLQDGRVLVAGGQSIDLTDQQSLDSAEIYDPRSNVWISAAPLSVGRAFHTATLLPTGQVLAVGGYKGAAYDGADPAAGPELFTPGRDSPGGIWVELATEVVERRFSHTAGVLADGRVLVTGGLSGTRLTTATQPTSTSDVFSASTLSWAPAASLGTGRSAHAATALADGRILVAGGLGPDGQPLTPARAELYDPETGRWADAGTLAVPRIDPELTLLTGPRCGSRCGKVLITGGSTDRDGTTGISRVELYSPEPRPTPSTTVAAPAVATPPVAVLSTSAAAAPPGGGSYRLAASDGGIFAFGDAPFLGSMGGRPLAQPLVGMAATSTGKGYWLVAGDGGIFAFGEAPFLGSMGGRPLAQPIVGITATSTGKGYWLVASDGGIFAFGDAPFLGSMGGRPLAQPIVGITATSTGKGYWLVAGDGGIFAFGDAAFAGSTGALRLAGPITAMATTPTGRGYWLVAADGGTFAFGDAPFLGSMGGRRVNRPIVSVVCTPTGRGYWLAAADGGIFAFGDAPFRGSAGALSLVRPIVGAAGTP